MKKQTQMYSEKNLKLFQPNNEENLETRKISKFSDKMIKWLISTKSQGKQ